MTLVKQGHESLSTSHVLFLTLFALRRGEVEEKGQTRYGARMPPRKRSSKEATFKDAEQSSFLKFKVKSIS